MTVRRTAIRAQWWAINRVLPKLCRIGLHFMYWDLAMDGYRCPCRKQWLWLEDIR